jgi:hypothetical protein
MYSYAGIELSIVAVFCYTASTSSEARRWWEGYSDDSARSVE